MAGTEVALSIALGVGLAAAVGFRVFLPMLVMSIAAYSGHLTLGSGFAWLGSAPALLMLAVAALLEIVAYYIPGVDNLLDALATPAALIAGTVVSAAVMADLPPLVKWTTAVIAGGGAAGLTQGITSLLRLKSTTLTGGLGNHVIASGELGGALGVSLLALAAPVLAVALVAVFCWFAIRVLRRLFRNSQTAPRAPCRISLRPAPGPARCAPRGFQAPHSLGVGTSRAATRRHSRKARAAGGSSPGARRIAPTGPSMDFSFTGRMASSPCSTSSSAT